VVSATRRGLLAAAGAGALLAAGCGAPDEPPPDEELLGRALALELALAQAYGRTGGRAGRELATRARRHAGALRAAGAREAGGVVEIVAGDPAEVALGLQRRAMAAYVDAVGDLRDDRRRLLAATLLTEGAQHASLLLARLGRDPLFTAFPDGSAA
jgi:hypothetical protein